MKKDIENLNKEKQTNYEIGLKNNVIIYGLPVTTNSKDELKKVVKKITESQDVDMDKEEFECSVIGRVGVKQVKVEFKNREIKDAMMKAKKKNPLEQSQKSFNYKFARFSDGKILLRKEEDSPIIQVKSATILENLKPKSEEKK
ncbi:hypothetical protein WA026_003023 [Henosepilachna vigintioctopunctata]|uniref:FP protein C-terminal domain-containing protein n=1 Tax=Henosepilachna vigintioctopunctata TaxID=420089 RepID=A0AAW1TNE6_9CUCU